MSGHGKSMIFYPYLTAFNVAWKDGIESTDAPVRIGESETVPRVDTMRNEGFSPEDIAIRKNLVENLSAEAKDVIMTILNCPEEILSVAKPRKYENLSKRRVQEYLKKKLRWSPKKIESCFREISELASVF